jgi:spore coat polysaccharide biosynthesis predicted glycosyltransferase SpsG
MVKPLVAFRLDANARIGAGHYSRCRSVASALNALNIETLFIVGENTTLIDSSMSCCSLGLKALGGEADRLKTKGLLLKLQPICLVLDGYHFDEAYRKTLSEIVPLVCFDDSNNSGQLYAQVVINALATADQLGYEKTAPNASYLLGEQYALLPEAFHHLNRDKLKKIEDRNHILVCFGAAAVKQHTRIIIEQLAIIKSQLLQKYRN